MVKFIKNMRLSRIVKHPKDKGMFDEVRDNCKGTVADIKQAVSNHVTTSGESSFGNTVKELMPSVSGSKIIEDKTVNEKLYVQDVKNLFR